ncbi:hypothetical protein SOV92_14660 [Pectobacterium brasiliense]|uniref:Uncharacterized protein n=1 Tax=Pectobacterium brasiliense TaxID=180957 RepID=A0AAW9H5B8_9GAMM|nr:hypothetical protein [Pectobacterium brasiliense]MDY4376398.1 hypothetical protein [Pectobacterium brasiliense]MDY4379054.1 hypothetical protein [Pectobacterium brasiliense]
MTSKIEIIRSAIEREMNIVEWQPTDEQILEMYNRIKNLPDDTDKQIIHSIVYDVYGKPIKVFSCSGLDTSKTSQALSQIKQMLQDKSDKEKK